MKDFYKHFIGKPCTITTAQINFRFQAEQMTDYYMGIIESIDDDGILMYHPLTKCKNYIFFPHIVGIHEEQILYEDNPEHAKIIEQYKKEKPLTAAKGTVAETPFVNPMALSALAKKAKANL